MPRASPIYKSNELISDSDTEVMDITESDTAGSEAPTSLDPGSSTAPTAVAKTPAAVVILTRDSVDRELDAAKVPEGDKSDNEQPQPALRKKSRKKAAANGTTSEEAPAPVIITYNLSLFPAAELAKEDLKKRKGVTTYFKLATDKLFDAWQYELLLKINEKMNPETISIDNYIVSFTIPRISPQPITVADEDDFKELLERLEKAKKSEATIYIQEKPPKLNKKTRKRTEKENSNQSDTDSSDGPKRKKKKKSNTSKSTRVPKATDIDEENQLVNDNIKSLRNRHICHKKPGCESEFCFINAADGGTHIPLTFPRLECWASALAKGPMIATLEMPPNHDQFRMLPDELLGQQTALSIRRKELEQKAKAAALNAPAPVAPPQAPAPVINVNFPPEMFQMHHGGGAPVAADIAAPIANAPASGLGQIPATLLSAVQLQSLGPRLLLADFCASYDISDGVKKKLGDNGYISSHALRFATLDDLAEIGLLRGEIAQLRDAVSCWCDS
ncbi:hypothetical protein BV22DRAFT_1039024 [Leucogyrophana mollusca]|uniref:Uncharacterized protein n=1 Tax=Leucogyrophana mollusca TaxID=85980 RepID=A0ACB8B877_9AGAM|nr:hypothetical protein BV22DRAFT_1039024 [Leucogyrophana mollusca]